MSYILRRVIFEDRWESQLAELIEFHRESSVEEVIFMEQSHQMLMVPYPLDKHRRMAAIYAKMAAELRKHGIGVGINIATIVGHGDSDVPPQLILPFQKIVDDQLVETKACYCILDPEWQQYALDVCCLYAEQFRPSRMFIDDDFRPTNHSRFMGCFCSLHADAVTRLHGKKVGQSELVSHIKGNNPEDFKVRRLWQDVHGQAEIDIMSRVRDAVAAISPDTQFGLMANRDQSQSIFGRHLDKLLDAMKSPGKRPLCRPAAAFYRDDVMVQDIGFHVSHHFGMVASYARPETEFVSEVEGWPHSRLIKSLKTLERELCCQAVWGAEKFSLNIFDYLATPMRLEKGYATLLKNLRPTLDQIVSLRKDKSACGLAIPWKNDMAAYISYCQSPSCKNPGALFADYNACEIMSQFGIPVQYHQGKCNLLFSEHTRAFSDKELKAMLSGGLLLDSTAAAELQQRGFGELLGCRIEPMPHNAAVLELFEEEEFAGPFTGTFCNTKWMDLPPRTAIHKLVPGGARVISRFKGFEIEDIAPGTVCFENSLGGRVVVFGAPINPITWQFMNRAYWMRQLVRWAGRDSMPVMVEDAANVGPFYFENPQTGDGLLAIISSSLDAQPLNIRTSLKLTPLDLPVCGNMQDSIEPLGMRVYTTQRA